MFKIRILSMILVSFFVFFSSSVYAADVSSQKGTVLPKTSIELTLDCEKLMIDVENRALEYRSKVFVEKSTINFVSLQKDVNINDVLGCGIKTGNIALWMIPFYVRYILEFIIGVSGLVAVGSIIFGGYLYLASGLSDQKEKGKNALLYGIAGFAITLVAWAVVNIVLALFTG